MEIIWQDIRYAMRMLMKRPTFTAVAILTLALGIGANTAIFSIINSVLINPLAYKDSDRLVMVWETIPSIGLTENTPAPANFIAWRDQNQVFESMAAFTVAFTNLTGAGEPEKLDSLRVSGNIFSLLGIAPQIGRTFTPEEDQPGASRVVMISHSLWQRRFNSDPNIINKNITLNDTSYEVVGVMPESFRFPILKSDLWVPIRFATEDAREMSRNLWVIGRLKSNATYSEAQAEISTLAARAQADSQSKLRFGINVVSLNEQVVGNVRSALLILLAATCFVLLIACANVANLQLARAASRHKEIAIRIALGAGRGRIVRQLVTESALLSMLGGAIAMLLALWGVALLTPLVPESVTQAKAIRLDSSVLLFTTTISLITGIVFGLVPALGASKPDLNENLKEGGRDSSSSSRGWLRSSLVVVETALALVLLIGAGLMLKSFARLSSVDMGFQPDRLLAAQVQLSSSRYSDQAKRTAFFDQLLERIQAMPGVQSAAVINGLPVSWMGGGSIFTIDGRAEQEAKTPLSLYRIVSPDYFRTLGIQLVSGRYFTPQDRADTEPVAIISESLALRSWPDRSPIGERLKWGPTEYMKIVGVVKDVKLAMTAEVKPHVYIPYSQISIAPYEIAIRTERDPMSFAAAVRNEVWAIDPDQPVSNIRTMQDILSGSITRHRFNMLLLAIFAGLALALATVGLYGVMSYIVAQGTREIGIRMALGAQGRDVLKLVIGQGALLAIIGIIVGLASALALTRLMSGLLFGVSATDPVAFVAIPLLLIGVALGASFVPARRAMKVDPMEALRYE